MIPLSSINPADKTFCFSFPEKPSAVLIESIKKINILNPVIVRNTRSSPKLQIITGFKRINAATILKINAVPARVYGLNELTDSEAYRINLYDNITSRELNSIEKALYIDKLTHVMQENDVIKTILPLFNIDANRYMFEKLIKLQNLPRSIQQALAKGIITFQTAEDFLHVPPGEQRVLFSLITRLSTGRHKSETMVSLMLEITKREHTTIPQLLKEYTIADILSKKRMSGTDRYHLLYRYLFNRRYPQLSKMQEDIQRTIRELRLPHSMAIRPPNNLEGNSYLLESTVKSKDDISRIIDVLTALKKKPALTALFKKL